jgi:integrase
MPLFDAKIRSLKPAEKTRKYTDSDGLQLHVTPLGTKLWRFAYRFDAQQKVLALGKYPVVSLAAARAARDEARRLLIAGRDPCLVRKREKLRRRIAAGDKFRDVAEEWFANNEAKWVESYSSRLWARLEEDLLPALGKMPIAEIQPIEVLEVIRRVEQRGAVEMAKRVMQMAGAIFRYGVATSRCMRDPTADVRGALKAPGPVKHRSALSAAELPEFLYRLENYSGDPATKAALKFMALTFVRTNEFRLARWTEFEDVLGPAPLWRIPAERMKMRRSHLVPLAPQAIEVLHELRRYSGRSPMVLPAPTREGVISSNTLIFALYRLGYHKRATVHGFRSTASTVLNEAQFNRDWIEMQLAHRDDSVRGIYNAADWLPGRREMMIWWADYLDRAAATGRERLEGAGCELPPLPAWRGSQRDGVRNSATGGIAASGRRAKSA